MVAKKSPQKIAKKKSPALKAQPKKVLAQKKAVKKAPAGSSKTATSETLWAVGQTAPDFNLTSDTGENISLKSLRGRKVVLYFYPKDLTPGCTIEACDFRDGSSQFKARGVTVLGVSADSVESHRKFKLKHGLNFPLLSDPEKKTLQAYRVWKEKSLYGRKFMGIERTTYVIDEQGKFSAVFAKVKVAGHTDAVLASL